MLAEPLADAIEPLVQGVLLHAVGLGKLTGGVAVEVAAHEELAVGLLQPCHEGIESLPQFNRRYRLGGGGIGIGEALGQLVDGGIGGMGALLGVLAAVAGNGQVAYDVGEIGTQDTGTLGGNGVPGAESGIVDALLGVHVALEDAHGHPEAVSAVGIGGLGYGPLVTGEV